MLKKFGVCLALCGLSIFPMHGVCAAKFDLLGILKQVEKIENKIPSKVHVASTTIIEPNGRYYEGKISYMGQDEKNSKTAYHHYKFILNGPATLKLHFISHVDRYVEFEMRDFDENIIKPFSNKVLINRSPFTETVTLDKGTYIFTVYKLRSVSTNSNTGSYRFKIENVALD